MADSDRKTNKLFSVCLFILVVEACERLCYYTIFNSMVFYLEDAGCDFADISADAKTKSCNSASTAFALRSSFRMLAYVFPIFGGYIADNVLGRYKTILYFTTVYVIGVALMALGAVPALMTQTTGYIVYLLGAFVFTAIGTGAIKPNVVNFGADQYDVSDPVEAQQQKSYFSYFYMVINVGSVFSAIWTVSLATSRVTKDEAGSGFMMSFTIAAVCMFLALMIFLAGTPRYSAESKSVVTKIPMVSIIFKHLTTAANLDSRGKASLFGLALLPLYLAVTLAGSLIKKQPVFLQSGSADGITLCSAIAFVLCVISTLCLVYAHKSNHWVPEIPAIGNGITTAEVKSALKVIPTILCINIGFNVGYNGMDIYGAAACQMNTLAPNVDWVKSLFLIPQGQLNGNFYSLGNNASIIIAIPLLETLILPAITRARGGRQIPRKGKYIAGFALVMIANFCGMFIEIVRRKQPFIPCGDNPADQCGYYVNPATGMNSTEPLLLSQCSPGGSIPMSDMSGWWTFIPYFITGCGEVLVNPVLQEFSFDEVAPRLRSLMMGFTLVAMGCVPSVITAVFSGFVPSDMNKGPIIWCYVANNVVSVILLFAYFLIAIPDRQIGQDVLLDGQQDPEVTVG